MTIHIACDICGRDCTPDFEVVTALESLYKSQKTIYVCQPRHGGDFGCWGFLQRGLEHAGQQAREARSK